MNCKFCYEKKEEPTLLGLIKHFWLLMTYIIFLYLVGVHISNVFHDTSNVFTYILFNVWGLIPAFWFLKIMWSWFNG